MSLKIEFSKAADVTSTLYMDRKLPKEVNDGRGAVWKRKPQDEWCKNYRKQFLSENQDFQGKEFPESLVNLSETKKNVLERPGMYRLSVSININVILTCLLWS
jgi:hypothetical protein